MGTRRAPRKKTKARQAHRMQRRVPQPTGQGENEFGDRSATFATVEAHVLGNCQSLPSSCQTSVCSQGTSTIKQVAAAALILGQNVRKTADALGIDRRTVQRWQKHDPEFQEALHDAKQEAVLISRQTLLALADSAVEMVETQLHRDQNPRVALAFLRGFGVLAPSKIPAPKEQVAEPENEIRVQSATSKSVTSLEGSGNGDASLQEPAEDVQEEVFEWEDLPPAQQQAAGALYEGQSLAATAAIAETTEEEIRDWLAHDLRFATVLSGLQFDRVCKLRHRLCRLTDLAVQLVQRGIQAGDSRLAMALLRGLGLMS